MAARPSRSPHRRWFGLVLIVLATFGRPAFPAFFAAARGNAASSGPYTFKPTEEEKQEYHRHGDGGDGTSVLYHFTSPEAAKLIEEQKTFLVSRNTTTDANYGIGVYVAPWSGERFTSSQMALQNFGEVTAETLVKSMCFFRIEVSSSRVHGGSDIKRNVLRIEPENRSASEIEWSELKSVEGPFLTKGTSPLGLARTCAEEMAQEPVRSLGQQTGLTGGMLVELAVALVVWDACCLASHQPMLAPLLEFEVLQWLSIAACLLLPKEPECLLLVAWLVALLAPICAVVLLPPAEKELLALLPMVVLYFPEVPALMRFWQSADASARAFRIPHAHSPELADAAFQLSTTWLFRIAAIGVLQQAGADASALVAANACFVAEWTWRVPRSAMISRQQRASEEAYFERFSRPEMLARLRLGMGPADLEPLPGEAAEEAGP